MHGQRVEPVSFDPLTHSIHGDVGVRKLHSTSVSLMSPTEPDLGQPLLISNLQFDCTCNQWNPCWHAAALLQTHVLQAGYSEPDPKFFDTRRNLVERGHFDLGWDVNDDSFDDDDEADGADDSEVAVPIDTTNVILFPGTVASPVLPYQSEPLPKVPVAGIYRDDQGMTWAVDKWLNQTLKPSKVLAEREHCLTYHLHRDRHDPCRWTVEIVSARRLKSGALGVHKQWRSVKPQNHVIQLFKCSRL